MARDQGVFAWVGDVILHGGLPYADAWDVKGPTPYLQSAATQALLGRNMWGVRLVTLVILAAGSWAVYVLAAGAVSANAGLWGIAFLVGPYFALGWWHTAQPDGWAAMLGLVAVALAWQVRWPAWVRGLIAGVLLGWIALYKPPLYAVFPLLLLAALALDRGSALPSQDRSSVALSMLAGVVLSVGVVVAWLGWRGGLDDAWSVLVVFNSKVYMQDTQFSARWLQRFLLSIARPEYVLAAVGFAWLAGRDAALSRLLTAWFSVGVLLVFLQMKGFGYHWTILSGVVAVGAGAATVYALHLLTGRRAEGPMPPAASAPVAVALILLVAFALLPPAIVSLRQAAKVGTAMASGDLAEYYADPQFGGPGDVSAVADLQVADYLRRETVPSDTVLVWGLEPGLNYLSARLPPTQYGWRYPITAALERAPELGRATLDEFMADLRRRPPEYFVVVDNDLNSLHRRTSREALQEIPELLAFLHDNYVHETTIEDFELWRRRARSATVPPG